MTTEIQTVGIIGAGLMGNGIAHVTALAGIDVLLLDAKPDAVDKAIATITKNLDRQVAKNAITADAKQAALARIKPTADYAAFAAADLVMEAATEKEEIKKAIFKSVVP